MWLAWGSSRLLGFGEGAGGNFDEVQISRSLPGAVLLCPTSFWTLCVLHGFGVQLAMRMCHDHW